MDNYIDPIEFIPVFVPKSLDDILKWKREIDLPYQKEWIFRGQRDHTWTLSSTLERYHADLQKHRKEVRNIYKLESGIWYQFIPSIEKHLGREFGYKAEKAAILQLFFAVGKAVSNYCVIYVLNYSFMSRVTAYRTGYSKSKPKIVFDNIFSPSLMERFFNENNKLYDEVLLINPSLESERIKIQEGCFLMPSNLTIPARENISNSLNRACVNGSYPMFFKFVISKSLYNEINEYLLEGKITRDKLFPEENVGMQDFIDRLKKKYLVRFESV